ncbi:MAG TPA: hypothetical protein V6C72_15650, partial [Chroococcales cyanobacterium]
RTLEVTIFRPGGKISLSDCEELSRMIDKELEERQAASQADDSQENGQPPARESLIEGNYLLEVQSPGIDRRLKSEREYEFFTGERVQIQTREKLPEMGANFIGVLGGVHDGRLLLKEALPVPSESKKRKAAQKDIHVIEKQDLPLDLSNLLLVKLHADF